MRLRSKDAGGMLRGNLVSAMGSGHLNDRIIVFEVVSYIMIVQRKIFATTTP